MRLCTVCHRIGHTQVHADEDNYCRRRLLRTGECERCDRSNTNRERVYYDCHCYRFDTPYGQAVAKDGAGSVSGRGRTVNARKTKKRSKPSQTARTGA